MGSLQIFFWIFGALLGIAALLMAFARTPPDDAISNLSKWAKWAGIHHVPTWLRNRAADITVIRWAYILSAIMIAGGLIIYFIEPAPPRPLALSLATTASPPKQLSPIPFSDNEVHGWLKPANFPTPPNGCDGYISADAVKVLIGTVGIARDGYGKLIALQIGTCDALSIERSEEGIFIDAELNDGQLSL